MSRHLGTHASQRNVRHDLALVARGEELSLTDPLRAELLELGLVHEARASGALFLTREGRRTLISLVTD
jgi:hypothetical protein